MDKRKNYKIIISSSLFLLGSLLILSSQIGITGSSVGVFSSIKIRSFVGFSLILTSLFIFMSTEESELEKKIKLTSSIDKDQGLVRYAVEATKNERLQDEMNHLTRELAKGHADAGLKPLGHVEDTNIFYMRGKKGARLFYRKTNDGYEIVGKASGIGKKSNEKAVMKKLKELYGH